MKNYLFFSLRAQLLFLALIVSATTLYAETVEIGNLYYSLSATTAQVVNDQSSDKSVYKDYTSVTVPASVTYNNYTYPVTSIGTSAFEGLTNLQSVTLPTSVTTIGTDAFYGCTKLGSVNLEEGLTTINLRAFYNCNLTEITIPSTVTSIGNAAFKGNPTTTIVWKPADCSIGSDDSAPFYSTNSQVTSFTFADGVELVPAYICKNMSLLDTIVLPASVNRLGQYAFMNCTNLKSINLPVTQKTLPQSFLEGCTSLETIVLPATLTTISTDAFYGCSSLKNVNLHEGITTIYQRAFQNCKLESVTIPSTVTSIGSSAFKGNPTKSVTWLPANCSVGTGDNAPFYGSQITSFVFGDSVKTIPGYLCYQMNKLDSVTLPEKLTTIGQYAFNGCSLFKNVTIPASVTSIGTYAFAFCTSLKNFEFPKGIKTVTTSVLEGCTALEDVIIPASVTTIGQDAFYNCSKLVSIHNYAITPQSLQSRAVYNVNKQTCILYVPIDYINLYRAADVWKDFANIIGVATDLQFEDQIVSVTYLKQDSTLHYMESQTWAVPLEPYIEGFTFVGWRVEQGMLNDGIVLRAVYESSTPTQAPEVYVNPANKAQKLIKNGNVYILSSDKTYTVTGQEVK